MKKYNKAEFTNQTLFYMAKAGYPFILISVSIFLAFAFLGIFSYAIISFFITLFICWFFRDPNRVSIEEDDVIFSPADGKVIFTDIIEKTPFYDGQCLKISIFMSIFDIHVNRAVCKGTIKKISYSPGKFFSANLDKASRYNEHNAIFLETKSGEKICMVQIAGLIARRIICYVITGIEIKAGQRFGMIRFGSRLDVYIPPKTELKTSVGEKVQAGITILGKLK